jgi:hypothetical protein
MHSARDALLGSIPKGPSDITNLDDESHSRQNVRECLARGEIESVRIGTFTNRPWIISDRYCALGDGVDSLEGYIRSIWYAYYELARLAPYETAEQDRLVLEIVRIQGLGPLTRPTSGNYGIDIARTVDGTLWNDLPFLATDMTDFWINNCGPMSSVQRLNFASFLAKLASTRVSKDRLCQIALILFRSTFEGVRELSIPDNEDEDPSRQINGLALADLLPAAYAWISEAGHNIIQLTDVFWNDCSSEIGQGGRDFVESQLGMRSPTGFTPWRWMFWLKRLHEIRDRAIAAHEEKIGRYAADCIECMVNKAKERNSGILRIYQNGGSDLKEDPHLLCLAPEPPSE